MWTLKFHLAGSRHISELLAALARLTLVTGPIANAVDARTDS